MSDIEKGKKDRTTLIVAINVIIMIVYTLITRIAGIGLGYSFVLALLLGLHIVVCLVISPFIYSKAFLLSALALLLIGFSTCYIAFSIH
jgi:hypothetical protein